MIGRIKTLNTKYINLLDQGFLSIVNFGATLVILKFAEIAVSGSYVITYSYSVAAYFVISLLISAPILVFFSKKWKIFASYYLLNAIFFTVAVNLIIAILVFYFLKKQVASISFLEFYLLCLGITLFDVLKKFVFAIRGTLLVYGLASTVLLNLMFFGFAFFYKDELTLNRIIMVYNISFFSANALLFIFILKNSTFKIIKINLENVNFKFPKRILQIHFRYSKWLLLGGLAFWGYSQGIYILGKYYGISDFMIAKVRLIQNLLGVFSILVLSMENIYMPIFSKEAYTYNLNSVKGSLMEVYKYNYKKIIFLFLLSIPIGLGFYEFFYSEKYGSGWGVFFAFIFVQFLLVFTKPLSIALKSVEYTKPFFIAQILALLVMIVVLSLMVKTMEGDSLVFAFVLANVVYSFYIMNFYYKKIGNP